MGNATTILPALHEKRSELEALCREFSVLRLEVFGSAADGSFDASRSDIDFLVEFGQSTELNAFRQFFGFQIALEDLFGRKIDLLDLTALRNPFLIKSINKSRKPLYAA